MKKIFYFLISLLIINIIIYTFKDNSTVHNSLIENKTNHHQSAKNECQKCHTDIHKEWKQSHHFFAMQKANSKTVKANFNISFTNKHIKAKFFKKGNSFFINTQNKLGKFQDFKVSYVFG